MRPHLAEAGGKPHSWGCRVGPGRHPELGEGLGHGEGWEEMGLGWLLCFFGVFPQNGARSQLGTAPGLLPWWGWGHEAVTVLTSGSPGDSKPRAPHLAGRGGI